MSSPDATELGLTGDKGDQQPGRRDVAPDLPRLALLSENQSKVERQDWLASSFSKQHASPSQTRLKWCGCLASSQCAHFTHYAVDPDIGSSSNQNVPIRFFVSEGLQQTHNQGLLSNTGYTIGERREEFPEPFYREIRQTAKLKAQIFSHPMYEQLMAAHLGCLRVATPVDHLQTVEAQLATAHHVAARYSMLGHSPVVGEEKQELDRFMSTYIILLHNFKEQLQEHVRTHAMEAVLSCWELEQAFIALTGMSLGEGSGATMSDDDDEKLAEPGLGFYGPEFFTGHDHLGLGPLIPTESERSLLERVRQELKSELKQDYKNKIADVREEILRKRRAGKLPTETTAILKKWWNTHSKWPYPTEDEKARLVQETGLELKQINNWFINQRKRNWHSHPTTTSSTSLHIDHSSLGAGSGQAASNVSLTVSSDTDKRPGDLHDADL